MLSAASLSFARAGSPCRGHRDPHADDCAGACTWLLLLRGGLGVARLARGMATERRELRGVGGVGEEGRGRAQALGPRSPLYPAGPQVWSESRQVSVCARQLLGLQVTPGPEKDAREEAHVKRVCGISAAVLVLMVLIGGVTLAVAAPEGQVTWGIHISLAPTWFDPAETTGIVTPFMVMYALHDAMVKPLPGN